MYREPQSPGVRIDSGVREGDTVSVHYDPLLAKVVATAETRRLAIDRLSAALRTFPILGIRTNIPFLVRVLESDVFRAGRIHTGFLDHEGAALAGESEPPPDFLRTVVSTAREPAAAPVDGGAPGPARDPWEQLRGWGVR
jgi:acetyl/propionyl-CoA carboxylase alpha subunit